MTTFLLAGRERDSDREKSRFALVNRLSFETKHFVQAKNRSPEILGHLVEVNMQHFSQPAAFDRGEKLANPSIR
jgi:hypothetical protein